MKSLVPGTMQVAYPRSWSERVDANKLVLKRETGGELTFELVDLEKHGLGKTLANIDLDLLESLFARHTLPMALGEPVQRFANDDEPPARVGAMYEVDGGKLVLNMYSDGDNVAFARFFGEIDSEDDFHELQDIVESFAFEEDGDDDDGVFGELLLAPRALKIGRLSFACPAGWNVLVGYESMTLTRPEVGDEAVFTWLPHARYESLPAVREVLRCLRSEGATFEVVSETAGPLMRVEGLAVPQPGTRAAGDGVVSSFAVTSGLGLLWVVYLGELPDGLAQVREMVAKCRFDLRLVN